MTDVREGTKIEFVVRQVSSDRDVQLYCVVSQPPKKSAPLEFFDKLRFLLPHYEKVVLTGDFNSRIAP